MAGGIDNNMRNFNAPDMGFAERAKALAQLAYGHGFSEGKSGGTGNMGIVGGKVIKFNTKPKERSKTDKLDKDSIEYRDMKESCDNLRQELRKMAYEVKEQLGDDFNTILGELGFESEENMTEEDACEQKGVIKDGVGLYTRKDAASLLKKLAAAYEQKEEMATGELVDAMWNGHKPSWGNSVKVFNEQVEEHENEVFSSIGDDLKKLVEDVIDSKADTSFVVGGHFKEYSEQISRWLDRTCDFLKGLVPQNSKNKDSLTDVSAAIDKGKKNIGLILDEMKKILVNDHEAEVAYRDIEKKYRPAKKQAEEPRNAKLKEIEGFFSNDFANAYLKSRNPDDVRKLVEETDVLDEEMKEDTLGWIDDCLVKLGLASKDRKTGKFSAEEFKDNLATGIIYYTESGDETLPGLIRNCWKNPGKFNSDYWKKHINDKYASSITNALNKDGLAGKYQAAFKSKARLAYQSYDPQEFMPENLGKNYEGSRLTYATAVTEWGFKEIGNQFANIFKELNKVKYADGKNHRDLFTFDNESIYISENDVPEEFADVKDGVQRVIHAFNHVVNTFAGLEGTVNQNVANYEREKSWHESFTKPLHKLSEDFDDKYGNQDVRQDNLKKLAKEYNDDDLKNISKMLFEMGKTVFYPGLDYQHDLTVNWIGREEQGQRLYGGLFNANAIPFTDREMFSSDDEVSKDPEQSVTDLKSFKSFIKGLVTVRNSETSIFSRGSTRERIYEADYEPAIPQHLFLGRSKVSAFLMGSGDKRKTLNTTLEFYRRLREVAVAFKIIDDETGNFI